MRVLGFNIKTVALGMEIIMLKIRRSRDRLISNMGIYILARRRLYIETAPWRLKPLPTRSFKLFNGLFSLTQSKRQTFALLSLCDWIHQSPVDSPYKGPVVWKAFPCHDDIMIWSNVRFPIWITTKGKFTKLSSPVNLSKYVTSCVRMCELNHFGWLVKWNVFTTSMPFRWLYKLPKSRFTHQTIL